MADTDKYSEIIHVNYKQLVFMDYVEVANRLLPQDQILPLKYKMALIFSELLSNKQWKYELHKDLDNSCLATSERICLNIAFLIGIRQVLKVDLPLIMPNPNDLVDINYSNLNTFTVNITLIDWV